MILSKELATEYFTRLYCGAHHIPGKVRDFGVGWSVNDPGYMSTWDMDRLTRAVFLAHDMGLRLEISPCMRYMRLAIHKRDRSGTIMEGHPTLEEAVASHRARNPLNTTEVPSL